MEFTLERLYRKEEYTIGRLLVNGKYLCDTLEDKERTLNSLKDKVYGKTAIPCGYYPLRLVWSNKFNRMLPEICDVRYFSAIRLHAGNDVDDTDGCPLVGENKARGKVLNSRYWEKKLVDTILEAEKNGDKVHHIRVK